MQPGGPMPKMGLLAAVQDRPRPKAPPREPAGLEAAARAVMAAFKAGDEGALAKALGAAIDARVAHRKLDMSEE